MNDISFSAMKHLGTVYPVAVAGATIFGASLHDWVYITAILAAVCQSFYLILKCISWFRHRSPENKATQ